MFLFVIHMTLFHRLLVNAKQHTTIICYSISNIDNQSQHLILLEFNILSVSFSTNHHSLSLSLSINQSTNQSKFVYLSNIFSLSLNHITHILFIHSSTHSSTNSHTSIPLSLSLSLSYPFLSLSSSTLIHITHIALSHPLINTYHLSLSLSLSLYIYIYIYMQAVQAVAARVQPQLHSVALPDVRRTVCSHSSQGLCTPASFSVSFYCRIGVTSSLSLSSSSFYCRIGVTSSLSLFIFILL